MNNDGREKSSGLWWKIVLAGMLVSVVAVIVGFYAMLQPKPEAEVYVGFNTGQEKTFEMTETGTMWLHETNFGLGSSPGSIEDAAKTVRVYGPDGSQLIMSEDRLGEDGHVEGTFTVTNPGTHKIIADSVGRHAESHGQLRGKRPYSSMRSVCDISFFYAFPTGLGVVILGTVMGIFRGLGRLMNGKAQEVGN